MMNIINYRVLRGPNIWSSYRKKLIELNIDLGELESKPTNLIEGFSQSLESLLPSLQSHRCSEGIEGGFFTRVRRGTWLGHVAEHIALELQTLADMECGFGRTRSASEKGKYFVVYDYEIEEAGLYAGRAAIRIIESLINKKNYDLRSDLEELQRIKQDHGLGPSTAAIVKEALSRDIPCTRLDKNSLIMLGYGKYQKMIDATFASTTSGVAADLVSDKELTKKILSGMYITFPEGKVISDEEELSETIDSIGFPVVIKPVYGNHGRGVTTRISTLQHAIRAFRKANEISGKVIVEKYIHGNDFRFLLIDFKVAAVALRMPAMITGDGASTISTLINRANDDPRRGRGHENILTKIELTSDTDSILSERSLTPESILPAGEILFLKDTANLSTGGTSFDVTDSVHPQNIILAERIARLTGLNICGLDIIAKDLSVPMTKETGALLEVNACPGFRMHLNPSAGTGRNVAKNVVDMLYPDNAPSRIPIIAVTGTNGKTTTTRLIAHFARAEGLIPGFTTTDGIYINNDPVYFGDCSGPESAASVLRDPLVDIAVLECARGGILRSGLGFDKCNAGIVTNITNDHLGIKDINTLEDLARVKVVVPRSVMDSGYAILNADDDLVYEMRNEISCNLALFSLYPDNPRIKEHCSGGGMAAYTDDGKFIVCRNKIRMELGDIKETPLTLHGTATVMIKNILPAMLAAFACGISYQTVADSLKTFILSPEMTPGRMNIFDFKKFKVMLDYAHNEDGFAELKKFMDTVTASVKTIIISATGDRRDEDIRKIGYYCSVIFDEVIIKHDKNGRGRSNEELTSLLCEGISSAMKDTSVNVISDEKEALKYAMMNARENEFIVICGDEIQDLITILKEEQNRKEPADSQLQPTG